MVQEQEQGQYTHNNCLLFTDSAQNHRGTKAEIKGHRNNGVGMDRRINIGGFFCMKQRSGFQRWGKMQIIPPKLFDARTPCFEFGFEALGVEKLIHQQGFLNTFPPSELSAWFIKAKKWLYMMMSFLSDCQLKPGSSVVRGKSFFAGRALLDFILKNKMHSTFLVETSHLLEATALLKTFGLLEHF